MGCSCEVGGTPAFLSDPVRFISWPCPVCIPHTSYCPSLGLTSSSTEWEEQISHPGPREGLGAVTRVRPSAVLCRVSSRLLLLGDTPLPPGAAEWRAGRGLSQQRAGHPSPLWLITQVVQLLTCDLLLSLRTALWQKQAGASQALGETYHASGAELAGFQRDLGSLRRLAHGFRPAYRKVRRTGRQGKAGRGPGTRGAQCGAAALALRGQTLAWVGRARTRLYSGFSNWYQSEKITLQLHLILF